MTSALTMTTSRFPALPMPHHQEAVLDDAAWSAVSAALARVRPRVGRPFRDERRTIEAVLWRNRHGEGWRDIPESLGPWWRAAQLYYRWEKASLWKRLRCALQEDGRDDLAALFASVMAGSGEAPP